MFQFGTANGFNGVYEIRKAFKEDVPMTGIPGNESNRANQ